MTLSKNFFELKECPKCSSKNMRIMDLYDYSIEEYTKSQIDDSWIRQDSTTGDLQSTSVQCLDCNFEDSWNSPKYKKSLRSLKQK